jgi:hypothetical protein
MVFHRGLSFVGRQRRIEIIRASVPPKIYREDNYPERGGNFNFRGERDLVFRSKRRSLYIYILPSRLSCHLAAFPLIYGQILTYLTK